MEITLDRESEVSLVEQIAGELRRRIACGELPVGARLLSSRDFAERLGVNRTTVLESYRALQVDGLITSGVGRGTFVTDNSAPDAASNEALVWSQVLQMPPREESESSWTVDSPESLITLSRAVGHPALFPESEIKSAIDRAFKSMHSEILDYASPAGYEPLREQLSARFEARGIDMEANELLIVNGSQQGLDLVSRLLIPGSAVVASIPTFSGALRVLRRSHTVHGAALDAEGIDPAEVDAVARKRGARLLYTIPFCHNPTGVCLSRERGDELLEVARRRALPILEDDWLGDLRTSSDAPSLKSRDHSGHVIYLGTMSKVLVPGLRIGWLVAPRAAFDALVALKRDTDLSSNLPGQAVLAELLQSGFVDRHTKQLAAALDRRRQLVTTAMAAHFPSAARPLLPARGMVMWVQLPQGQDERAIVEAARRAGVEIAPGSPFLPLLPPEREAPAGLRISYARAAEADLVPAIRALGRALHEVFDSQPAALLPPLV